MPWKLRVLRLANLAIREPAKIRPLERPTRQALLLTLVLSRRHKDAWDESNVSSFALALTPSIKVALNGPVTISTSFQVDGSKLMKSDSAPVPIVRDHSKHSLALKREFPKATSCSDAARIGSGSGLAADSAGIRQHAIRWRRIWDSSPKMNGGCSPRMSKASPWATDACCPAIPQ